MKVTKTSDEGAAIREIRTRGFEVIIEDPTDGDAIFSAWITYARYTDLDECIYNQNDIKIDDDAIGDESKDIIIEICRQLDEEGFSKTEERFT